MESAVLIKGIVMGFSIAAPVGPIALLCIQRTLSQGPWAGLATGLGAATADGIYGLTAGLGLSALSALFLDHRLGLQIVGGIFLCWLGIRGMKTPAGEGETEESPSGAAASRNLASAYLTTLGLTLTNPMTLMAFAAVFSALGQTRPGAALTLSGGVFLGSGLWWLLLALVIAPLGRRLTPAFRGWIQGGSGIILVGFGLAALIQGLKNWWAG